jgi:hypothetical protein
MNLSQIFKEALLEAKKEKPSAGLTKKQKSDVAKKAKAGKDIGKKGKGFEKIAKKAGGGEKGEKIAAAAMWKNIKRVKEGSDGMDHEVSMAKNSLESIAKSVMELMQKLGNEERDIPGWIQDHISNAENFIDQAAQGFHELGGHDEEEEEGSEEESEMIQPVAEKKLTKAEKAKKEEIIKSMAKKGGGKEKMGPKQYAIATAQAIKSAE